MKHRSTAIRVLGAAAVLTVGLIPGTAVGASSAAAAACTMTLGSVSAGGDHLAQYISATSPPPTSDQGVVARDMYSDGQVRLSGSMLDYPDAGGSDVSGFLVLGSAMYASRYSALGRGEVEPSSVVLDRVGGGWGEFVAFEESRYEESNFGRTAEYGLRKDGVLFRWTATKTGWRSTGSYAGFASVKTMALISKTRSYDTFLANTRGGALYTIHIPTTSPMRPVVKQVRSSTWQGFESLIAQKCGQQGTLLLGIDKDTQSAYLYAVGHATGTSTIIQSIGKVPGTFGNPVYFRWAPPIDPHVGE